MNNTNLVVTMKTVPSWKYAGASKVEKAQHNFDRRSVFAMRQSRKLQDAIYKYHPTDRGLERDLQRAGRSHYFVQELTYMNPYARLRWLHCLRRAFQENVSTELSQLRFVTVIDERWHQSLDHWNFDIADMRRRLRDIFKHHSFLGMIEFAHFSNRKIKDDYVVAPHLHCIVWDAPGKLYLHHAKEELGCGMEGAYPLRVDKIYHLDGVMNYLIKAPFYGYRMDLEQQRTKHRTVKLSMKQLYRLHEHFRGHVFPDFCVAGGNGLTVSRRACEMTEYETPRYLRD